MVQAAGFWLSSLPWLVLSLSASAFAGPSPITDCTLISSVDLADGGSAVSQPDYKPHDTWYNVTVPATVMAGLLQNNVYPDPFYAENLRVIPTDPFDVPWWYRCAFTTPVGNTSFLTFKGINYKANVWLDGQLVGTVDDVVGTFRYFSFPIPLAASQASHAVALEIYRPHDRALGANVSGEMDLAISFVDWNPYPPDSNMGKLCREKGRGETVFNKEGQGKKRDRKKGEEDEEEERGRNAQREFKKKRGRE